MRPTPAATASRRNSSFAGVAVSRLVPRPIRPISAPASVSILGFTGHRESSGRLGPAAAGTKAAMETPEDRDLDAAPEGTPEPGRPDVEMPDEGDDEGLSDEGAVDDPDAEQQDPESGPAADDA